MSVDRDFPVLGRPYIVKLKGVWQEDTYVADQADGELCPGERFWSRDDLDECPSFDYEHDDWISIREAVDNRNQIAALKEENEQMVGVIIEKEERIEALSERCADAESEVTRLDRQVNALKARVAELDAFIARLVAAGEPMANAMYMASHGDFISVYECQKLSIKWRNAMESEKDPANEA